NVHGRAAGGNACRARVACKRSTRAAGTAGVHRWLGNAMVSRVAAVALRATQRAQYDEGRRRGALRNQVRALARDRQSEVRARRELSLSVGSARVLAASGSFARNRDA